MIRVLIIATTKFNLGGITNVILNYYRALDKSDMQIDFVIPNVPKAELSNELGANGSHIYILDDRKRNPFAYIRELEKIVKINRYDIVHAHGNSCTLALEMLAGKKGGAKVRIAHNHSSSCKFRLAHKMLRYTFDRNYTHAFACGEKAGRWMYNKKPFQVIKNGINLEEFSYDEFARQEYRKKMGLEQNIVIGHVGRFTYEKNHKYMLDVFAELYKLNNNYRLLLVGEGELRGAIERKVCDLGLSQAVIFTGNRSDVPKLMSVMDVFVLPSQFEGFPLTLVEAQSACLPCFVSDVVARETAITGLITFISLEKSHKEWAKQINDRICISRESMSNSVYLEIVDAGFGIKQSATHLKSLYIDYIGVN